MAGSFCYSINSFELCIKMNGSATKIAASCEWPQLRRGITLSLLRYPICVSTVGGGHKDEITLLVVPTPTLRHVEQHHNFAARR